MLKLMSGKIKNILKLIHFTHENNNKNPSKYAFTIK